MPQGGIFSCFIIPTANEKKEANTFEGISGILIYKTENIFRETGYVKMCRRLPFLFERGGQKERG